VLRALHDVHHDAPGNALKLAEGKLVEGFFDKCLIVSKCPKLTDDAECFLRSRGFY
jgi:hypothetical protein